MKNSGGKKLLTKISKNNNEFDYEKDTWTVIDNYFAQMNNKQILKHQLESFQHFTSPQLKEVLCFF